VSICIGEKDPRPDFNKKKNSTINQYHIITKNISATQLFHRMKPGNYAAHSNELGLLALYSFI